MIDLWAKLMDESSTDNLWGSQCLACKLVPQYPNYTWTEVPHVLQVVLLKHPQFGCTLFEIRCKVYYFISSIEDVTFPSVTICPQTLKSSLVTDDRR